MSREPREFSYSFYVTRTKEMGYAIDLDEKDNIVSVSERSNIYKGKEIIESKCRTQDQCDKDFETFVSKCLKELYCYVDITDLMAALNEEMLVKYFGLAPK